MLGMEGPTGKPWYAHDKSHLISVSNEDIAWDVVSILIRILMIAVRRQVISSQLFTLQQLIYQDSMYPQRRRKYTFLTKLIMKNNNLIVPKEMQLKKPIYSIITWYFYYFQ